MNRLDLFDSWASFYDQSIGENPQGYPFEGYYTVLNTINNKINISKSTKILDLGIGTGLLTMELYKRGAKIYGIDFSEKMIIEAKKKMPTATFYCNSFEEEFPSELNDIKFDYIISSYAFHHLSSPKKIVFIKQLLPKLTELGVIYIADVSFESKSDLEKCKTKFINDWDNTEFYFTADEFVAYLLKNNIKSKYSQISSCAGIYEIKS
ncbi:methyltransferase domain-containing protein [bacterium]|nr:methyltransferase domain-containing protein [bacterium]